MYGRKYTDEERTFLRAYAYGHSYKEIVEEFNCRFKEPISISQVKGYLGNHRISTGRTGRFEKGYIPANKGTHIGGWEPTQFKKGHIPQNHKPVGTESIRADGYIWVKVKEPNRWKEKHRLVWEAHNGSIPKGKCIIFLDGNPLNVDIDNLMMIDKRVNARLNQMGMRFCDKDSTLAAVSVAELVSAIGDAKRR